MAIFNGNVSLPEGIGFYILQSIQCSSFSEHRNPDSCGLETCFPDLFSSFLGFVYPIGLATVST